MWGNYTHHVDATMRELIGRRSAWLTVFRFPSYSPALNPAEGVWAYLNQTTFAVQSATSTGMGGRSRDPATVADMGDDADAAVREQIAYYRARASEYDRVYAEREDLRVLRPLIETLPVTGDVLELACGTDGPTSTIFRCGCGRLSPYA
nr:transposase [Streptomyces morookaense]